MQAGKVLSVKARVKNVSLKMFPNRCNRLTEGLFVMWRGRVPAGWGIMIKGVTKVSVICELSGEKTDMK